MAHDVFISYAGDDRTVAAAICSALERRRIRCWIAPRDVIPGSDYGASIVRAITSTTVTVLVFSEHSNGSPHVRREVERSVSHGIPVLPFRVEDVVPSPSLEYFISDAHWLDAMTPPLEKHIDHLAETVELLLAQESAGEALTVDEAESDIAVPEPAEPGTEGSQGRWRIGTGRQRGFALAAAAAAAVVLLGGGTWLAVARLGSPPAAETPQASVSGSPTSPLPALWSGFEWRYNPGTEHYYALTDTGRSWDALEAQAVEAGGHLVALNDADEEAWVNSTFGTTANEFPGAPGPSDHWLRVGLRRDPGTETWQWTTGEPVTYLNWCPGATLDVDSNGDEVDSALVYLNWPEPPCWDAAAAQYAGDYLGLVEVEAVPD